MSVGRPMPVHSTTGSTALSHGVLLRVQYRTLLGLLLLQPICAGCSVAHRSGCMSYLMLRMTVSGCKQCWTAIAALLRSTVLQTRKHPLKLLPHFMQQGATCQQSLRRRRRLCLLCAFVAWALPASAHACQADPMRCQYVSGMNETDRTHPSHKCPSLLRCVPGTSFKIVLPSAGPQ